MHLPSPPAAAQQLSQQLEMLICQQIVQQGPLNFAEYMELALYHSELGYYNNSLKKFGESGDFTTAPETSDLFARCLANQIGVILNSLPNGNILEFGAGSGQLALDILLTLQSVHQLPKCYYILEISKELRTRQQQKLQVELPDFYDQIIWLEQLPKNFSGVVIANEVLDAMPIHCFCFKEKEILEYFVDCHHGKLQEKLMPANEPLLEKLLATGISFTPNYHSEISLHIPIWLANLADCIFSGVVLLIDYGFPSSIYYHSERCTGTLMCHYQHYAHSNPYFWPGLQDITAHIDFTAVARTAITHGFSLTGYTTQSHFLLNCGLMEFAAKQQRTAEETWLTSQAIKKLVLPSEMGELFKVMALSKGISIPLMGFKAKDQSYKL